MDIGNVKKIVSVVFAAFAVAFVFAFARPSLDGRVAVADAGELPSGMFAEAVGFRPGDTVSVVNQLSGKSVEVLVTGAIDASEGFAVRLSPEAAAAIGIGKNSNVLVKVSKVASSSEIQTFSDDADGEADEFAELDSAVEDAAPVSDSDSAPIEQRKMPSSDELKKADVDGEKTLAPAEDAVSPISAPAESEPSEIEKSDAPAEPVSSEPSEPASDELTSADSSSSTESEPAEDAEQPEPVEPASSEGSESAPSEIEAAEPVENIEPSESASDSGLAADTEPPVAKEAEPVPAEPEAAEPSESAEKPEPLVPVKNEVPPMPEEESDDISTEEGEHYQPIFLTPADMNPPSADEPDSSAMKYDIPEEYVSDESTADSVEQKKYEIPEEFVVEPDESDARTSTGYKIPEEYVVEPSAASGKADAAESGQAPEDDPEIKKRIVDRKDLKSGKYIQVARLSKTANMKQLLDKLSGKYDVVFVPSESERGTTYQVLVGPLGKNYKKIQKELKSAGFKDAFVK